MVKSLRDIKGVGEKIEKKLIDMGIDTPSKLLKYTPLRYEKYEDTIPVSNVKEGEVVSIEATIIRRPSLFGRRMPIVLTTLDDGSGKINAIWFHSPFLLQSLIVGKKYVFRGKVYRKGNNLTLNQAKIYTLENYEGLKNKLVPIYRSSKDLKSNSIYKIILNYISLLKNENTNDDFIPKELLDKYSYPDKITAYKNMHMPDNNNMFKLSRDRLVYEEFLLYQLGLIKMKDISKDNNIEDLSNKNKNIIDKIISNLPYKLTNDQLKVLDEIWSDFNNNKIINRLIEGDVGSGKTILAFIIMIYVSINKYQSVLLAPTEVLARQHFENLKKIIEDNQLDIKFALLTGSTKKKERDYILDRLQSGDIDILIGTHAVYSDDLIYKNLALCIIDEQHRFGVNQRKKLIDKSIKSNLIYLSATPIPRTLSFLLFNGMDISRISEKPKDRLSIKTAVISEDAKEKAYDLMSKEIDNKNKAIIICPLIEDDGESDYKNVIDYSKFLKKKYKYNISVLHGKMKDKDKEKVMYDFVYGDTDILVSTTVIEVGIDCKDATFIMVEDAENFGLATLHQLRGRVGRSDKQSYCVLVDGLKSEKSIERLDILKKYNDGFIIAEKDLDMRGGGDVFGIRQSGDIGFVYGDIYFDKNILEAALNDAKYIIDNGLLDKNTEYYALNSQLDEYVKNGYTI